MQQSASDWHGMDADVGAPRARHHQNGRIVELGTNGNGELVERKSRPQGSSWGLPPGTAGRMRERFQRLEAKKENSGLDKSAIRREAVKLLRERGPMTKHQLAAALRVWVHQANHALTAMKNRGEATCWYDEQAKGRKFLWAATDT